tara:strand:- start:23 stop:484 length:462 start_codon:yes stop_codon:yes gene_type:complete
MEANMPRCINKTILIGNLGADPDHRTVPSGASVANASIAVTKEWTDAQTGEKKEVTYWHRLVFWRGLADVVKEYCKKGSRLYVEGELQSRTWEDDNDEKHYVTEIEVREISFLDAPNGTGKRQQQQKQQPQQNGEPEWLTETTNEELPEIDFA